METTPYEAPTIETIGTLHDLTLTVKDPRTRDGIVVSGVGPVGS